MSNVNKKPLGPGAITVLVLAGLIELGIIISYLLIGKNVTLFNPQGFVAHEQHSLFVLLVILLLAAAVPVVLFLYFVAWKFRESNTKAVHKPNARQGKFLVFSIWAYPILFFFIFTAILIPATHKLEPRKALASDNKALKVQVIALRWKWLFLYPEQKIATVNYVKIPQNTPIIFDMTADDAPMSSFWIPNIGGQLYAMTGHSNRLNLLADKVGDYPGSTAEINGAGFADMTFTASVDSRTEFNLWVQSMQHNPTALDSATYDKLVKPSEANPQAFYGSYETGLYDTVMMKYGDSHGMHGSEHTHKDHE